MKRILLIFATVLCVCKGADEEALEEYYQLDESKPLRYALHDLIDDHDLVTYDNAKAPLQELDADPNTTGNVIYIYSLLSVDGTASWWKEHLWPNSYGLDDQNPAHSDLHNLRPSDSGVNRSRSNKVYDWSDSADSSFKNPAHANAPLATSDSDSWQPPESVRGDVARAAFYMATRYIGDELGEPDLVLTDDLGLVSRYANYFGKLSTLLQWHEADPPDDQERLRNDLIHEKYQGNRNPYIDRPEYAELVFNDHADPDNDGLTTFEEVFIHKTDPKKSDSNGDGLSDGQLVSHGIPPTLNLDSLLGSVVEDTHFRSGGILVERVGDQYQLKLTIEKSDDLKTWTTYQEQTILIDAEVGKQFLRVKVE